MKRRYINLFLGLSGLIFALLVCEALARAFIPAIDVVTEDELCCVYWHQPDRDFIWPGNPGFVRDFPPVHSRWNSQGFHDKEYPFDKAPGTFRIVVVGDSFVDALQVPLDKTFHKRLESMLNENGENSERKFEVIGLGTSGNGAKGHYKMLTRLGMRYHPDLVIMEFLPNDVRDDSEEIGALVEAQLQAFGGNYFPPIYVPGPELPFFLRESRLFALVGQRVQEYRWRMVTNRLPLKEQIPVDFFVYQKEYDEIWPAAWDTTQSYIVEAYNLSKDNRSAFLLVAFTEWHRFPGGFRRIMNVWPAMKHFEWDFEKPERILADFCQAQGIGYLALQPLFNQEFAKNHQPLHFEHDGHWNEQGHELAARLIYQRLADEHLIPIE